MQSKKQLCRYYQRGTCQYGTRCKFAHENQQPSKPNNPFGFGAQQQQQQQTNPFGFGAQSSINSQSQQPRSAPQQSNPFGFGVKPNNTSSKPFENKWSRFSANPGANTASSSRQSDGQPPAATHSCTDPDTCKKQIAEDFQHERPLWKLTCYGHHKCAPCDIIGDVSYEELRISAYTDSKSGMSLPLIVEKERQLLNAKLGEFESLLHNPYKGPANSVVIQSPFPQATSNAFSAAVNNVASPSTWTFGQPASSLNIGSGVNATTSQNTGYKQPGIFQNAGPSPSVFGNANSPFGGFSNSAQPTASPFGASRPSFPGSITSAPSSTMTHSSNPIFNNSTVQTGANPTSHGTVQAVEAASLINKMQQSDVSVDEKIWLKEKWHPGEIPETPPPERFVF